ncbi:capsule biosynthesis protein [Pseudogemmobacter sonorensis]|uniref:capsule biosynthesis protein n=1 Tax=Pseudogemmobacter sonorensis TaxID=2989681 RepID=UPI0036AF498B
MTMLDAIRFHTRPQALGARPPAPAPAAAPKAAPSGAAEDLPFDNHDDGFGDQVFPTAARATDRTTDRPAAGAPLSVAASVEETLESIRREGLTGRQLRTARRIATRHNLPATSDFDAVRLLREAGVDPFQRGSMLDLVSAAPEGETKADGAPPSAEPPGRALTPLPGDGVKLPQTVKPIQLPSTEKRAEVNHAAEILKMQQDIARRRRRKLALLMARMFVFVFLPTLVAGWYFSMVATPLYATKSEFQIKLAESPAAQSAGGLLQGTAMATQPDSIAVQGYLQSRDAMLRLESDLSFRAAFQGERIDPILRLPDPASQEQAYKLYQRYVQISYDPSEGIIKMEVSAPDPQVSAEWSRQLLAYAEQQVDQLTHRLRENSMSDARTSYEEAEQAVIAAQQRVVELQERYKVLSSDVEVTLLTQQISQLETQLTQDRLSLVQMEANDNPNAARMEPIKRRIAALEAEIGALRKRLTEGEAGGESLARIQGELMVAQADVETRQMILAQALQAMENARVEANRQTRYLTASVSPVPPDEPTYPRAFENTLVTMLILLGIYLMVSMTVAILREQVSA